MRRARNHIDGLMDNANRMCIESEEIGNIVCNYFASLFSTSDNLEMSKVLDCVEPKVIEAMNDTLCQLYTMVEVEATLKQMHPRKAPGPDGKNPFFYQHH